MSNLQTDDPPAVAVDDVDDVMATGFRGTREIARTLRIVETQLDLLAARARLEPHARLRPRQRTTHAAEIELDSHTAPIHEIAVAPQPRAL